MEIDSIEGYSQNKAVQGSRFSPCQQRLIYIPFMFMAKHGKSCGCGSPISWKVALILVLVAIIVGAFLSSCAKKTVMRPKHSSEGHASWYGPGFHGRKTANGERYNQNAMTAAHKKLPFGTKVKVTNLNNNKTAIVRINDRGPYVRGRIIDVSKKAAKELAMLGSGTAPVRIETLEVIEVEAPKKPSRFVRGSYKRISK